MDRIFSAEMPMPTTSWYLSLLEKFRWEKLGETLKVALGIDDHVMIRMTSEFRMNECSLIQQTLPVSFACLPLFTLLNEASGHS